MSASTQDPSNDNFFYFNDQTRFPEDASLLTRYKNFNNTQGNSAANENSATNLRQSATNLPDDEDLNQDNTLNESESYFQYEIPLVQSRTDPREIDRDATPLHHRPHRGRGQYRPHLVPLPHSRSIPIRRRPWGVSRTSAPSVSCVCS